MLRAWWSDRQGLASELPSLSPAQVLSKAGWARSVGGSGPYLTLFSRAGIAREVVDQAVARLEIHELPSARGCAYVVPAEDFPLALFLAGSSGASEIRTAEKLGVSRKEIDKLCEKVVLALEKETLDPEGIREACGNAVRSLGAEGKKKGLTTTLPVALEILQNSGQIRRVPVNGRLDQQRFQYMVWRSLEKPRLTDDEAHLELAKRFFRWIGPARASEFQNFAGIGVKAAKAALEPLKLEPLCKDDDRLLLPEDRSDFERFAPPKDACYRLVSSIDSLLLLRRDLSAHVESKEADHPLLEAVGPALKELPSPAIVDRGRIVGLWEFDVATESIAYACFIKKNSLLKKAVAETEEFIRRDLGDARAFSLDSPKSRVPRIEALRQATLGA